jgi:hypothetical protein
MRALIVLAVPLLLAWDGLPKRLALREHACPIRAGSVADAIVARYGVPVTVTCGALLVSVSVGRGASGRDRGHVHPRSALGQAEANLGDVTGASFSVEPLGRAWTLPSAQPNGLDADVSTQIGRGREGSRQDGSPPGGFRLRRSTTGPDRPTRAHKG